DNYVKLDSNFRDQLREHLIGNRARVLMRILMGPTFDEPLGLTGCDILERSQTLVERSVAGLTGGVVLLLLPHSPELFLLHLGLILKGYVPGILAWPTSRVDPEKYQRNLVHQLCNLPASALITLPRLAQNLSGALPYLTFGCSTDHASTQEKIFPADPITE